MSRAVLACAGARQDRALYVNAGGVASGYR